MWPREDCVLCPLGITWRKLCTTIRNLLWVTLVPRFVILTLWCVHPWFLSLYINKLYLLSYCKFTYKIRFFLGGAGGYFCFWVLFSSSELEGGEFLSLHITRGYRCHITHHYNALITLPYWVQRWAGNQTIGLFDPHRCQARYLDFWVHLDHITIVQLLYTWVAWFGMRLL